MTQQQTQENGTSSAIRGKLLKSAGSLSFSVLLSRVLGLLRDILLGAVIGGGFLMSAWVQATTLANIFRQVLGEGALGQALVPILARELQDRGIASTRKKFTTLFIYLTLFLTFITIVTALPMYLLADHFTSPIWHTTALLLPIVMPYSIFICAVGVMTSCMNMLRIYFLPSLTAILQNLVIITALYFICPLFSGGMNKIRVLAFSVLAAGIVEFVFMLFLLKKEKMQLDFSKTVWRDKAALKEIFTVAFPGILASGAHIFSTLADRLISGNIPEFAGEIGNYATSALYYSDRLVLLPVGVFAFAFGTVALTEMSRAHAEGDTKKYFGTMLFSLQTLLFLTIPMTAFLFVFSKDVLELLFLRGAFGRTALEQTLLALLFYVPGIPAFCSLKIITAAFTSRKDMRTPFYTGLGAIALNIVLNLILMFPLRQGGIALATVIASYCNNFLLMGILLYRSRKEDPENLPDFKPFFALILKLIPISLIPLAAALPLFRIVEPVVRSLPVLDDLIPLGCAAAVYGILFLILAKLLRMPEADAALRKLKR